MGSSASALQDNDILRLAKSSGLQAHALRRLHNHFMRLDTDHKGYVDAADFQRSLAFALSPVFPAIAKLMARGDARGAVSFDEFAVVVGASLANKQAAAARLVLRLLDGDDDGKATLEDVEVLLVTILGHTHSHATITAIAKSFMGRYGKDTLDINDVALLLASGDGEGKFSVHMRS